MFLLLLDSRCSHDEHARRNDDGQQRRLGWHQRLARGLQQMAVYLGDAYLAAEGCRGDILCAAPEYFQDAIKQARRRRRAEYVK